MDVSLKTAHLLKSKHDASENTAIKRQKMNTVAENSSHLINSQYAIILINDCNHFIYLYSHQMQQSRRNKEKAENEKREK